MYNPWAQFSLAREKKGEESSSNKYINILLKAEDSVRIICMHAMTTFICEKQGIDSKRNKQRVAMRVRQQKLAALSHHCSYAVAEEVLYESLMGPSMSTSFIFIVSCTRAACKPFSGQIRPQWRIKVAARPVQLPSFACEVNEKSPFEGEE